MTFTQVRVAVLSGVLLFTVAWAIRELRRGPLRADWDLGVRVGVVLVVQPDVPAPRVEQAVEQLRLGEAWLHAQAQAHGRPATPRPFTLEVTPVDGAGLSVPAMPADDAGLFERIGATWRFWRFRAAADRLARDTLDGADAMIYVVLDPPAGVASPPTFEGLAQQGQRWGFVRAHVDAPFGVATAALHETLHCVGATDKYDDRGHPTAAADVGGRPAAELMAGEIAGQPGRIPRTFGELAVGARTAAEIGW